MSSINIPSLSNCINNSPPVMRKNRLYSIKSIILSQSKVYFLGKLWATGIFACCTIGCFTKKQLSHCSVTLRIPSSWRNQHLKTKSTSVPVFCSYSLKKIASNWCLFRSPWNKGNIFFSHKEPARTKPSGNSVGLHRTHKNDKSRGRKSLKTPSLLYCHENQWFYISFLFIVWN